MNHVKRNRLSLLFTVLFLGFGNASMAANGSAQTPSLICTNPWTLVFDDSLIAGLKDTNDQTAYRSFVIRVDARLVPGQSKTIEFRKEGPLGIFSGEYTVFPRRDHFSAEDQQTVSISEIRLSYTDKRTNEKFDVSSSNLSYFHIHNSATEKLSIVNPLPAPSTSYFCAIADLGPQIRTPFVILGRVK